MRLSNKLEHDYGATIDGEVQKDDHFEVATLRSQDGHMVSVMKVLYEEEIDNEDGLNSMSEEASLDPRQQEIKRLLDSMKL